MEQSTSRPSGRNESPSTHRSIPDYTAAQVLTPNGSGQVLQVLSGGFQNAQARQTRRASRRGSDFAWQGHECSGEREILSHCLLPLLMDLKESRRPATPPSLYRRLVFRRVSAMSPTCRFSLSSIEP
jgi:hypothetical protein